jgi:hypothetical protein
MGQREGEKGSMVVVLMVYLTGLGFFFNRAGVLWIPPFLSLHPGVTTASSLTTMDTCIYHFSLECEYGKGGCYNLKSNPSHCSMTVGDSKGRSTFPPEMFALLPLNLTSL